MKKIISTTLAGTVILSSGIIFGEQAEGKVKSTNMNYYSKSVINKIKSGKMTTINGVTLDKPTSYYKRFSNTFFVDDYSEPVRSDNNWATKVKLVNDFTNYTFGISDFQDNIKQPKKIDRIVHDVVSSGKRWDYTKPKINQLYGKPSKSNTKVIRTRNNMTTYYVDYYKHVTFIYHDPITKELDLAIYPGKEFKKNPAKWKAYINSKLKSGEFSTYQFNIKASYWFKK